MDDFNSIVLEGHVVRDPDSRTMPKGTSVCSFSIAVNRSYRASTGERKEEVSFFDVESWGSIAEECAGKCVKGRGIRVAGRLKQNRWQDSEGKTQSRIRIIAEHVDFKPMFSRDRTAESEGRLRQEARDIAEAARAERDMLAASSVPELCEAVF